MFLGVIADDFTGGTDIAGFLVENGMKTIQLTGTPQTAFSSSTDAIVISLKSRSCPVDEAIQQSLQALRWLKEQGCQQFYFKYCSTFDSTEKGNIGPVTDALLAELNETFTIICPALPINGRSVYQGHLFVQGALLNESGMRHHPVTPMRDANLMRLMDTQAQGKTGLVTYQDIEQGAEAIAARWHTLQQQGYRYAVMDTLNEKHLSSIGAACRSLTLITGGSGLAAGIAQQYVKTHSSSAQTHAAEIVQTALSQAGKTVILSGSCSEMTNKQVANYCKQADHFALDISACLQDDTYIEQVANWVMVHLDNPLAPLVYATAEPHNLRAIQAEFGAHTASQAVEQFFYHLAQHLQQQGVNRFIVAGGETSGVVTQSLKVQGFHIGPQIAPGVPWVTAIDQPLSLALKSGNFGDEHFFTTAQRYLHD